MKGIKLVKVENKKQKFLLNIDVKDYNELKKIAIASGLNVSYIIRKLIKNFLIFYKKQKK